MIIIVSGFAGSGTSTLAQNLGTKLNLKIIHASGILRELSKKSIEEVDVNNAQWGKGFWESEEGIKLVHDRLKDGSMDKALDKKLLEIIEEGDVVLDSYTMGYLSEKGIKIWVEASVEERAKRVSIRDKLPVENVAKTIKDRDATTIEIYKKLYNFSMGEKLEKFDFILNNENLSAEQSLQKALDFIKTKE